MRRPADLRSQGFNVIELLAVIAVTAIVGAMGYSAFRTHTVRAQVDASVAAAAPLQNAVLQAFRLSGEVPTAVPDAAAQAGLDGRVLASLAVQNGRIDLTFDGAEAAPELKDRRLSLTPYETASLEVIWLCGNKVPGPGLSPLGFAGGGRQSAQLVTTIDARFLPAGCR